MLRAAYFAQELLSTFSTALGEVALQPATGGTFIVEIFYALTESTNEDQSGLKVKNHILWDRKSEGGFPETKELKRRVRDIIEPGRDLGHVDGKKKSVLSVSESEPKEESKETETARDDDDQSASSFRPPAISRVQGERKESGRNFTPMDVDSMEMKDDDDGVKRNPDGSLCEDCL